MSGSGSGAALADLAAGRSSDAFAHLGPHPDLPGTGFLIRVLQPAAESVEVLLPASGRRIPAPRDMHGLFTARVDATASPDYRLRVTYPGPHVVVMDDP